MNTYLLLKWIHILSSVLLVGTGLGSAFYMYFTLRTRQVELIEKVAALVVRADWWFTTPAVIIQPLSGLMLVNLAGYSMSFTWIQLTLVLYAGAGLCWLPVVWLQIKMKQQSEYASAHKEELPEIFWTYAKYWERLGYPAFIFMLVIYWLMVFKPIWQT